jgi:hypothetical protein
MGLLAANARWPIVDSVPYRRYQKYSIINHEALWASAAR